MKEAASALRGIANSVMSAASARLSKKNVEEVPEEPSEGPRTRAKAAELDDEAARASVDKQEKQGEVTPNPREPVLANAPGSESLVARAVRVRAADLSRVQEAAKAKAEHDARRVARAQATLEKAARKSAAEAAAQARAVAAAIAEAGGSESVPASSGNLTDPLPLAEAGLLPIDVADPMAPTPSPVGSTPAPTEFSVDTFVEDMQDRGLSGVARLLREEIGIASLAELKTYSLEEVIEWLADVGKQVRPGTPMEKKLREMTADAAPEKSTRQKSTEKNESTEKIEPEREVEQVEVDVEPEVPLPPKKKQGKKKAAAPAAAGLSSSKDATAGEKLSESLVAEAEAEAKRKQPKQGGPSWADVMEEEQFWKTEVEHCPILLSLVEEHFLADEREPGSVGRFCRSVLSMFRVDACEDDVEVIALQIEAELEFILDQGGTLAPDHRGSKALRAKLVLERSRAKTKAKKAPEQKQPSSDESSGDLRNAASTKAAVIAAAVASSRLLEASSEEPRGGRSKSLAAERARERIREVAQDPAAREALSSLHDIGRDGTAKQFLNEWSEANRNNVRLAELLHTERLSGPILGASGATSALSLLSEGGEGLGWEGHAERVANDAQLVQTYFVAACKKARLEGTCATSLAARLSRGALFGTLVDAESESKSFKLGEMLQEDSGFTLVTTRSASAKVASRAEAKSLMDSSLSAVGLALVEAHPTDSSVNFTLAQVQRRSAGPTGQDMHHDVMFGAFFRAYAQRWADFQTSPVKMPRMEDVWDEVKDDERVREAAQLQREKEQKERIQSLEEKVARLASTTSTRRDTKKGDPSLTPAGPPTDKPGEKPNKLTGKERQVARDELHAARRAAGEAVKAAKQAADEGTADAEAKQKVATEAKQKADALDAKLKEKA
jgi:hypothetical protein